MENQSNLRKKLETKKKPKYAMRKLSVGFVSCMLGFAILFGDVATASANGVGSLLLASSGIVESQIDDKFTPPTQVDESKIPVVYFVKNTEKGIEKGKVKANTRVEVSELKEDKAPSKKVLRVHQGGFWDNGKNSESAYELTQKVYSNTNYKLEFSYFDAKNGTIGIKGVSEVNGSEFKTGKSEGYELGKTSSYIPKTYNILTKNDKKVYQGDEAAENAIFYAYFNKGTPKKGNDLDIRVVYARLVPATPDLKIKQSIIQVPLGNNKNKQASYILKDIETTTLKDLLNSDKPGEGIVVDANNNENPVPATLGDVVKDNQITKAGDSFEVSLTAEKWGQKLKDGKIQVVFYDEESYDKAAHEPKDIVAEPETKLVEGTGKSGDIIVVKDKNQTEIGRGIVSSDGKFSVAVNRELKEQEVLELKAVTGKSESSTVEATVKPVIRELKAPADVVKVEDPANLSEEEQKQIKEAVLKANPDLGLTQDNIKVDPKSGKVTVDTEKVKAELEPGKVLVKKTAPVIRELKAPTDVVEVEDPANLSEEEQKQIKEAVLKANPDLGLTQDNIKVDPKSGKVTVDTEKVKAELEPGKVLVKKTAPVIRELKAPADVVKVEDPANLSEEEQKQIKEAVLKANPDLGLTQDNIKVDPKSGKVTVDTEKVKAELEPGKVLVKKTAPVIRELKAPTDVVKVEDPANLSEEEQKQIKEAVLKANPDLGLTQDNIKVDPKSGKVTVDTEKVKAELEPGKVLVKKTAPVIRELKAPTDVVKVEDPANLSEEEQKQIKEAVLKANPDLGLTQDNIKVDPKSGKVTVDTEKVKAELEPGKVLVKKTAPVIRELKAPADVVKVEDPANLSEEEQKQIKEAVLKANPDLGLTQDNIKVDPKSGKVTVDTEKVKAELEPGKVLVKKTAPVIRELKAPADVVKVEDPANLSEEEQKQIKEAVLKANPDLGLTQDNIKVDPKSGKVTVDTEKVKAELEPGKVLVKKTAPVIRELKAPADVVEVEDPTNLSEEEQKQIKEAVLKANPDLGLTQDNIKVDPKSGKVTVDTEKVKAELEPGKVLVKKTAPVIRELKAPADVVKVEDPANLSEEEQKQIKEAVLKANPDLGLTQDNIKVDPKSGKVTVDTEKVKAELEPGKVLVKKTAPVIRELKAPADVVKVEDPANLSEEEQKQIKEAVLKANPDLGLTQDNIKVDPKSGKVTVDTEKVKAELEPGKVLVKKTAPVIRELKAPADVVKVEDPANLSEEEQKQIKEAVLKANPDLGLTQDNIKVDPKSGKVTVDTEKVKAELEPGKVLVKKTAPVIRELKAPADVVKVEDPANLSEEEQKQIKEAVLKANPDLGLTQDNIKVDPKSGKVTVDTEKVKAELEPGKVLVKKTAPVIRELKAPADVVEVEDPTNLSEEEQKQIKEAVLKANPDLGLTQDNIKVDPKSGKVTVDTEKVKAELEPGKVLVKKTAPVIRELKAPADVVKVEDPANLSEEEQKQIKEAVLKANPDLGLTQDNIKVDPKSGKVTVDTEKVKAELEPGKVLVKKTAPVIRELKAPTDVVKVEDPANLSEEEQKQIKEAVLKANPDLGLTQDNIKVDPKSGKVTVDTEKVKAELEPGKVLVKKTAPVEPGEEEIKINVPSSKIVVRDPNRLTDLEKDLIKEAVKKTNPTIDSNSIKVDDRGNVTIRENGKDRVVLTPSQTIIDGRDNYRPEPRERDGNDNNYNAGSIDFRFVKAPAEKRGEKAQVVAPKKEEAIAKVIGTHKAYIFGYKDGSVRPYGEITRAEAAAMVARLMGYSLTDMSQPAFADTQSAWYNQYINAVVKAGIMSGYPDGTFKPNEYITRAEFAQILKNLDKANTAVSPFGDVKGHWAEKAIDQAFANQRIKGYEDGTFKPEKSITRAEVVTILNRMQNRTLGKENLPSDVSKFSDLDENAWYYLDMVSATNSYEYAKSKEKADGTHQMVKVISEK